MHEMSRPRKISPVLRNLNLLVNIAAAATLLLLLSGCQSDATEPASTPDFINDQQEVRDPDTPLQNVGPAHIAFDLLTVEQGLSQSTVTAILQDNRGLMWFGTDDGLNLYDGYGFTIFRHNSQEPKSLSSNHVRALVDDGQSRLWIATSGGGLNYLDLDNDQVGYYRHDESTSGSIGSDNVHALLADMESDRIWIGTDAGLDSLDVSKGRFQHYPFQYPGADLVTALQPGPAGSIWVGTLGGLMRLDPSDGSYERVALDDNPDGESGVTALALEPGGALWIGTVGKGILRFSPDEAQVEAFATVTYDPVGGVHNTPTSIALDQFGSVWIGTVEGLERLDPESGRFQHIRHVPGHPGSLSSNAISSLAVDESGILWVGTLTAGLSKYDPLKNKFEFIHTNPAEPENGLSHSLVWSVLEDSTGILWIGTEHGLNRYVRRSGHFTHFFHNPADSRSVADDTIRSILEDSQGRLWFGTYGGLSLFDRQSEQFTNYRNLRSEGDSLANSAVFSLYEDSKGDIWVGTLNGLDRLDANEATFSHYRYQHGILPSGDQGRNTFMVMLEDKSGRFWVGTMGGLAELERATGRFTYYRHDPNEPDSLSQNDVLSLLEDSHGRFWVGTGSGLNLMDRTTGRFTRYGVEEGLPNEVIYSILEDAAGYLWISTNRGIARFSPDSRSSQVFDTDDGLQSLEFNAGAYFKSKGGEMFFGGINGLNAFLPRAIKANPYVPPVIVTDFQLVGDEPEQLISSLSAGPTELVLNPSRPSFSFELAALHYATPEDNQYAYYLEGFDQSWNFLGNRRYSTYTNLPPGRYVFRAMGSNSDGVWNENGVSLQLIVPYPFYRETWFVALALGLMVALLVTAYWMRTRRIALRTKELEEQVAARTSEIEQRRQIAEGLREILVILNSDRSLEESLHHITDQAARLTEAEDTIIFRRDDDNPMNIVATNPGGQIRYTAGASLLAITRQWTDRELMEKKPLIISDLSGYWPAYPEVQLSGSLAHKALMGIPLFIGAENYGGLIMFYTETRSFSEEDLELGLTFADQAALAVANDRLREQAKQTAVASERSRLARDLHDAVTQTLFSASLIAETLPSIWDRDREEGIQLLQELRQLTRGAQAEMRTLLVELRPAALEEANLVDLLKQLSEAVTGRTGVPVHTDLQRPCQAPTDVRVSLYRIAQEALNNVMKHARATRVELALDQCVEGDGAILTVSDNGRGFNVNDVTGQHLGLDIIRERAQLIDASLEIDSSPGEGTRVRVEWRNGGK